MDRGEGAYMQAVGALPPPLRQRAMMLAPEEQRVAEEIRLRLGQPPQVVLPGGERTLAGGAVTAQEVDNLVELASGSSLHTVLDQLRRGYLALEGGHRLGLCGTAVMGAGAVQSLRRISSVNLRIARQRQGIAQGLLPLLLEGGQLQSTLILAPPGAGKTTLLRDVLRCLSAGVGLPPQRVGLADERGEVAALWQGIPQLEVGPRTDVVEGCPKAQGLMLLLRAMGPQVLAADEITAPEDVEALLQGAGCGVSLVVTAHGRGREDLYRRPLYRGIMEAGVFRRLVTIRHSPEGRQYGVEVLE